MQLRFAFTAQLARHFFSHRNSCNRRCLQLEAAGYLRRDKRLPWQDAIWRPTRAAVSLLREAGWIDAKETAWTPKQARSAVSFKVHEAQCSELWFALVRAAERYPAVTVERWQGGQRLNDAIRDRDGTRYPVCPDRFFQLRVEGSLFAYLLELDRGTKTIADTHKRGVREQLLSYSVYYQCGGFVRKYGRAGERPEQRPFRLLVTTPTAARRNNLVHVMVESMARRQSPPSPMRAYGLFDEILRDPFARLWLREVEVAPVLAWLERLPPDQAVGTFLPAATYGDVRARLPADMLVRAYRVTHPKKPGLVRRDVGLRDAFIEAMIQSGRLQRFSILEPSWRSASP